MTHTQRLRFSRLIKSAGFWDVADTAASFIPILGPLKDAGKGIYHAATGQGGKAMADFAWAGAGLIPGAGFARGGAKLMGSAGAKALGLGAQHAGKAAQGLRFGAITGVGGAGEAAGMLAQPGAQAPQAPPQSPYGLGQGFASQGFQMPTQPQGQAPYGFFPGLGQQMPWNPMQQPQMQGQQMPWNPMQANPYQWGMMAAAPQPQGIDYGGLIRSFAGNGFGTA